jgi:hypothetical protein
MKESDFTNDCGLAKYHKDVPASCLSLMAPTSPMMEAYANEVDNTTD